MIDLEHVTIAYATPVVRDLSLHLNAGEYALLAGPSGSGKTTLALALAGLLPQLVPARLTGSVRVDAQSVAEQAPAVTARLVGLVYQNPATQLFNERVEEEIAFGPRNLGLSEAEIAGRVDEALAAVGIEPLRQRVVRDLSGGEQQRVAIAAVLAMRPSVLVLDEPLAQLDPEGVAGVLGTLERLHCLGMTILLIEHRLDHLRLGEPGGSSLSRAILLEEGRLVSDGPASQVLADEVLLERLGLVCPLAATPGRGGPGGVLCRPCPPDSESRHTGRPLQKNAPLVTLTGITAGYRGRTVLHSLDLAIHEGEFAALVGPNGAGKTTLARLLAGVLRPQQGRIAWAPLRQGISATQRVGLLFQNPQHQLVCDTVEQEVAYGLDNLSLPRERLEPLLAAADLGGLRERPPQALSLGQQQRAALAAVLSASPRLLILDEPTLGQDWGHLRRMMDYLAALNAQGQTILLITHDWKLVHRYTRRIITLGAGRVVADEECCGESKGEASHEMVAA